MGTTGCFTIRAMGRSKMFRWSRVRRAAGRSGGRGVRLWTTTAMASWTLRLQTMCTSIWRRRRHRGRMRGACGRGAPVMCGPRGLPYAPNILLHNEGGGKFKDVSVASGISEDAGALLLFGDDARLQRGWLAGYLCSLRLDAFDSCIRTTTMGRLRMWARIRAWRLMKMGVSRRGWDRYSGGL